VRPAAAGACVRRGRVIPRLSSGPWARAAVRGCRVPCSTTRAWSAHACRMPPGTRISSPATAYSQ